MTLILLWSFALSFRKTALNSDFTIFFHDFIHAGAGEDNSIGVNFGCHRKLLSLRLSAVSFRRTALNSDFTKIFFMILYMNIAPGQGQITSGDMISRKIKFLFL